MTLFWSSVLNMRPSGVARSNIQQQIPLSVRKNTHTDRQNTVPVSTDPNCSSSTGDFTHEGIGLHPARERGAVSTLTHILPFLTWLQQWCNALGFQPSPHPVPAHPWIFVPPSSPPLASSLSFSPQLLQHRRARSSLREVTALSRQTRQWKTFERNQNTPGPSSRRSGDGGAVAMGTRVNTGRNKGLKQLAAAWLSE